LAFKNISELNDTSWDLVVIGGGTGGAAAAVRAAQLGLRVLLVDKGPLGGTCVNVGCVPTKFLLRFSDVYHSFKEAVGYGLVHASGLSPDLNALMAMKDGLIQMVISYYTDRIFPSYGVSVVLGEAMLLSNRRVAVKGRDDDRAVVEADNIVVATGSRPKLVKMEGLEEALSRGFAITSDEALSLREVPGSLVIIGGGAIGVEMASLWHKLGSKVSIVEALDRLLPMLDRDLGRGLERILAEKGVEIHTRTTVTRIDPDKGRVKLSGGEEIEADKVLIAVGRVPNVYGLGLENAGVEFSEKGLQVDDHCKTNIGNIYAVGDVTGRHFLASTAIAEGIVAAENAAGLDSKVDLSLVPIAVFSSPEVGSVGVSTYKGDPGYIVVKFPNAVNYRALASGEAYGFSKVVVEKETRRLVGFHMVGMYASEIVNAAVIAIRKGLTLDDSRDLVFSHPAMSEVFLNALWLSNGVNVYLEKR